MIDIMPLIANRRRGAGDTPLDQLAAAVIEDAGLGPVHSRLMGSADPLETYYARSLVETTAELCAAGKPRAKSPRSAPPSGAGGDESETDMASGRRQAAEATEDQRTKIENEFPEQKSLFPDALLDSQPRRLKGMDDMLPASIIKGDRGLVLRRLEALGEQLSDLNDQLAAASARVTRLNREIREVLSEITIWQKYLAAMVANGQWRIHDETPIAAE